MVTARQEWGAYWTLAFSAFVGYSSASLYTFMLGPLMSPLAQEFGWSRVQITSGLALVNACSSLGSPLVGSMVDRLGPRRIGLFGVPLLCGSLALLATATGSMANWIGLWALIALTFQGVNGTIWASAVASRFQASRGLALAIMLSGAAVSTALAPLIMTRLTQEFGWRTAVAVTPGIWGAVALPILFLFFRGAQDVGAADRAETRAAAEKLPGLHLHEALRLPSFYQLLGAAFLFAVCILGSAVHFVPMLTGAGAAPMIAASAASMIGIFSIVGRLGAGLLLDRLPAPLVGAGAALVPVAGAGVLLWGGLGEPGYFLAAAAFGLTLGSEFDLMSYLAARQFGLKKYGAILGAFLGAIAFGGVVGPLAAGAVFDRFGDYSAFMMLMVALMVAASALIGTVRRPRETYAAH
jgi:predicted MFS family arabinose efflux permease